MPVCSTSKSIRRLPVLSSTRATCHGGCRPSAVVKSVSICRSPPALVPGEQRPDRDRRPHHQGDVRGRAVAGDAGRQERGGQHADTDQPEQRAHGDPPPPEHVQAGDAEHRHAVEGPSLEHGGGPAPVLEGLVQLHLLLRAEQVGQPALARQHHHREASQVVAQVGTRLIEEDRVDL